MLEVIVLAAGQGSRMRSNLPKVLHPLAGRPLIQHVLDVSRDLNAARIHVVVGHEAEAVESAVAAPDVICHLQREQCGTGHAVQQAIHACEPTSTVLVLFGDVPLISAETLRRVVDAADGVAMLSAKMSEPAGYGRVIRDDLGAFDSVVEHRDATVEQLALHEVNTGVLAASAAALAGWLDRVKNDNAQGEYYLPDVLTLARQEGVLVNVIESGRPFDALGVNTPEQLEALERLYQRSLAEMLLHAGVSLADRARLDIRGRLQCGENVRIDVNVIFEGDVVLGDGVFIGANSVIANAEIGPGVKIHPFTHIDGAVVGAGAEVGPYARLRPGTVLDDGAKIGNFVEIKNTHVGARAKANHLAYLGDAEIGTGSNVGAGTITCNYDGANKHRTTLGKGVFVGSNSTLVAPLKIGDGGFIAAGSTITDDVKNNELAVARGRQRNVEGWQRPTKPEDTD